MIDFILRHSDVVSAVTNVLFLAVWGVYLHLFLLEFRRERKPRILLQQTGEQNIDSVCILSNMSKEPVNIVLVTAIVRRNEGEEKQLQITERRRDPSIDHLQEDTSQGPLKSGGYFGLVRFRTIFERACEHGSDAGDPKDIRSVEIRVVFTYGPNTRLHGARRSFWPRVSDDGHTKVVPESIDTEQLLKRKDRKTLHRWVEDSIRNI